MNKITTLLILLFSFFYSKAQIGIGVNPPDPSAVLHVQDTTRGLLIPRMKEVNRIAIESPAEGLMVYQINAVKGFWYFTNGQWRSLSPLTNGGKHTLLLSGDISNAEAAAKIATDVGPNTQEVRISNCTSLTTVDLSMISSLAEIYIGFNPVLQSVNLNNLQYVDGTVDVFYCPLLATLPLSNLNTVAKHFKITNLAIQNLNLPLLRKVYGEIGVFLNSALTSISFPQLVKSNIFDESSNPFPGIISYFKISLNPMLTSITLSSFPEANVLEITNNENLATLSVPLLAKAKNITITGNRIGSLSFPALKKTGHLDIQNNNFLTSISLPVMDSLASLDEYLISGIEDAQLIVKENRLLQSISLPALKTCERFDIQKDSALTIVSAPLLKNATATYNTFFIKDCILLTSIVLDGLTHIDQVVDFSGNKLPSARVNYVLNKLATLIVPYSNHEITLTQIIPAPPTGQGLIDKATLQSQSNIVTTD